MFSQVRDPAQTPHPSLSLSRSRLAWNLGPCASWLGGWETRERACAADGCLAFPCRSAVSRQLLIVLQTLGIVGLPRSLSLSVMLLIAEELRRYSAPSLNIASTCALDASGLLFTISRNRSCSATVHGGPRGFICGMDAGTVTVFGWSEQDGHAGYPLPLLARRSPASSPRAGLHSCRMRARPSLSPLQLAPHFRLRRVERRCICGV